MLEAHGEKGNYQSRKQTAQNSQDSRANVETKMLSSEILTTQINSATFNMILTSPHL